jgi:hypothetical protein
MQTVATIATKECVDKVAREAADRTGGLEDAVTRQWNVMVMGAMLRAHVVEGAMVDEKYLSNAVVACQDTSFRLVIQTHRLNKTNMY